MGLAIAKRFGREGFTLALVARRAEALAEYKATLQEEGFTAHSYPADAVDPVSLTTVFAQIKTDLGDPAVLVYNAMIFRETQPSELAPDDLVTDFQVNVAGALICAQQVIPAMKARGSGTILLTGGGLALRPYPLYASLATGKAALRNLAYSLHAELAEAGIHVATVTIAGYVQPGTHFDPDLIAEEYWKLHTQEPGLWYQEVIYQDSD